MYHPGCIGDGDFNITIAIEQRYSQNRRIVKINSCPHHVYVVKDIIEKYYNVKL